MTTYKVNDDGEKLYRATMRPDFLLDPMTAEGTYDELLAKIRKMLDSYQAGGIGTTFEFSIENIMVRP